MVFKTKMKCPICDGAAVLSKTNLSLFNGVLSLKNNPIYECTNCKEKFAVGKMADETLKKAKKEFSFTRQVISTGGSLGVTFPADLSQYYKLTKGENIRLVPKSSKEISLLIE